MSLLNVYFCTDEFCTQLITVRILLRIKSQLASIWRDIGYELIDSHIVENIDKDYTEGEEKCFAMLKTWHSTDTNPCFCKLFAALEIYQHSNKLREIKKLIAT